MSDSEKSQRNLETDRSQTKMPMAPTELADEPSAPIEVFEPRSEAFPMVSKFMVEKLHVTSGDMFNFENRLR